MNKIEDSKVKRIIHSIGLNNNMSDDEVRKMIESQFRFTYEEIRKLRFNDLTDEEINKLKTNFYYKYLGKLYTDAKIVRGKEKQSQFIKQLKEEDGRQRES